MKLLFLCSICILACVFSSCKNASAESPKSCTHCQCKEGSSCGCTEGGECKCSEKGGCKCHEQ